MRHLTHKAAGCVILCAALLFFTICPAFAANTTTDALAQEIAAVFDARKQHSGNVTTLLDSKDFLSKSADGAVAQSSTFTDWIALAMGRFSVLNSAGKPAFLYADAQAAYRDGLARYVTQQYAENGGMLSKSKVTEAQRLTLTAAALGADVTRFGTYGGKAVDLIADSSYNCPLDITRQGMMGVIFALIAKNACDAKTPQTVKYSDEFLYTYLLERELPKGGWTLMGTIPDPDVTAMALCALALHRKDATVYTVKREADAAPVQTTLGAAVERGLGVLSRMQRPDGSFSSGGTVNCESAAQVLTALCMCGIDPETDTRFLKNGSSVLDALRTFRLSDGGFAHTLTNGKAKAYNVMATDQAAYALVALWRLKSGLRGLYDMRPDLQQPLTVLLKYLLHVLVRVFNL